MSVTLGLTPEQVSAALVVLNGVRPIYEEPQLTGYDPLTSANAITVAGNTFYRAGVRTTLRGVSLASLIWTDPNEMLDSLELEPMFANINCIRIPVHESHWNTGSYTKQEFIDEYLDPIIQRIKGYGKYAIIDCHPVWYYSEETMLWVFDFWENVAHLYKDDDRVIYELFNEPTSNGQGGGNSHSLADWLEFKSVLQPLVDYVRKRAPSNHLIIGSPEYSTRVRHAATHPFTGGNLSYTYHTYPNNGADHGLQLQHHLEINIPLDLIPLFITEWGYEEGTLDGREVALSHNTYYPQVMERFFLDHPNVSHTPWNYDTESRPAMLAAGGALLLSQVNDIMTQAVDYTPLDTPLAIADYLDVPDLFISWDALRSTVTEVSSKVSEVSALAGSLTLAQTNAARRPIVDAAGINGQKTIYFSGGYNGNYLNVSSADTLLNSKDRLTFIALIKPESGNVGNAPIFTFDNGSNVSVTLTANTTGELTLAVKSNLTTKYITSTSLINGVETLALVTVDFVKSICTLEYGGTLLINSNFGTTTFNGSTAGVVGGSAGGSISYKGHIGILAVLDGIYEYRYKKALIEYITENRRA